MAGYAADACSDCRTDFQLDVGALPHPLGDRATDAEVCEYFRGMVQVRQSSVSHLACAREFYDLARWTHDDMDVYAMMTAATLHFARYLRVVDTQTAEKLEAYFKAMLRIVEE
jgi:hypothetical protein